MAKQKRDYHHGDLRPALLQAAVDLVKEKGDTSFGLRDLAAKVGVSHPALYRHFKDRSALFCAIAVEGFSLYGETQKVALEQSPPEPQAQLLYLGRNHLAFALDNPVYFRIMFGAKTDEQKIADDSLHVVATPTFETIARVASRLRGDAPMELALSLWATVHGLALLCLDRQLGHFVDDSRESVMKLVDKSVSCLIAGYELEAD